MSPVVALEHDRTAAPAVAAVGAAARHERLAPERSRAFAAVPAAHDDAGGVDELPPGAQSLVVLLRSSAPPFGSMLTRRPSLPTRSYFTLARDQREQRVVAAEADARCPA